MRAMLPIAATLALTAAGCGSAPPATPIDLDVFDDVYLRGAPSPAGRGRVAVTFDGPTACTGALLGRLHAPHDDGSDGSGEAPPPLVATFMISPTALEAAAERDADGLAGTLDRLLADGHGLALRVDALPATWRAEPAAMRKGLTEYTRSTQSLLAAHGVTAPPPLAVWRPPSIDPATLALGAAVERPMVLWTLKLRPDARLEVDLPRLIERISDGDIIALPGGGPGCPGVVALPRIAAALTAAGLDTVTLDAMLGDHLARYAPPQLVRYRGPGLPGSCRAPLGLPPATGHGPTPDATAIRWGLLHRAEAAPVVLPVPDVGPQTDAVLAARARLDHLWRTRRRWSGLPACVQRVSPADLLAPITPDRAHARGRIGWWMIGARPDGPSLERRDPRAIGRPAAPVELPARADLARVEARHRLPGPVRGVVAQALARVELDLPALMELQRAGGVVVGAPLTPADADDPVRLQRAVAGYVQVAELSMGEYLYLARTHPRTRAHSQRTARGAEGFLRPGPHLVLARPGQGPDPQRLSIDGAEALPVAPATALARVLAAGHDLTPGDVVAVGLDPPQGAPLILPPEAGDGLVATLRAGLVHAVLAGTRTPRYLRPGSTRRLDGDLLGVQWVRLVVPAGVAAPTAATTPLVEVAPGAADDAPDDAPNDGMPEEAAP